MHALVELERPGVCVVDQCRHAVGERNGVRDHGARQSWLCVRRRGLLLGGEPHVELLCGLLRALQCEIDVHSGTGIGTINVRLGHALERFIHQSSHP